MGSDVETLWIVGKEIWFTKADAETGSLKRVSSQNVLVRKEESGRVQS